MKNRPMNKERALEWMLKLRDCLEGKTWSLIHGTLLGACREGDFIDWDFDIDILLHEKHFEDLQGIVKCLNEKKCKATLFTFHGKQFVQIYWKAIPGHIMMPWKSEYRNKFFAGKMTTKTIQGEEFPVPEHWEELLTERYGDWKTPVKIKDWIENMNTH